MSKNSKVVKRLKMLRKAVEDSPRFSMSTWGSLITHTDIEEAESVGQLSKWREENPCGTACCLAGEAALLAYEHDSKEVLDYFSEGGLIPDIETIAAFWLGMDHDECNNLFMGDFSERYLEDITKEDAIKELDRLINEHGG